MKWGLSPINAHRLPADEGFVIRVTYYYSACVGTRTPDCSVLCDPDCRMLIGDYALNHLHKKMTVDGIPHEITSEVVQGETRMRIFPTYELDSAFALARRSHSVVNMNDNAYDADQIDSILGWLGGRPSIALLGYTRAGDSPPSIPIAASQTPLK